MGQGGAVERFDPSSANCGGRHGRVTQQNRSDCRAGGNPDFAPATGAKPQTARLEMVSGPRFGSTWAN